MYVYLNTYCTPIRKCAKRALLTCKKFATLSKRDQKTPVKKFDTPLYFGWIFVAVLKNATFPFPGAQNTEYRFL